MFLLKARALSLSWMFCRTYFKTFAKCDVCLTEFHLKLDAHVSGVQSVGLNAKQFRVLEGLNEEHF